MKKYSFFAALLFLFACGGETVDIQDKKSTEQSNEQSVEETNNSQDEGTVKLKIRTTGETMADMAFEPKQVKVPEGSIVSVELINEATAGAMIHNFVLVRRGTAEEIYEPAIEAGSDRNYVPDHPGIIASSLLARPGDVIYLDFEAPEKGIYQFICTYPGHAEMKGIFIVE